MASKSRLVVTAMDLVTVCRRSVCKDAMGAMAREWGEGVVRMSKESKNRLAAKTTRMAKTIADTLMNKDVLHRLRP
ncbi:hypothetical protein [Dyella sp. M7H15-1]|uniref:hypothetical protein n=1 Tax=Dyella sp. M7H15-1 TaxID=2501295 RepID=UPI0013E8C3B1|nr:hypothetical protein [Dyella sp. M7H15-1]